jgi:DNA polymerase III subunit delta'
MQQTTIIGHELVRDALDRAIAAGNVQHAYLIHGPAGVGKATLARWLAQRLNCTGPAPPCGTCASCQRILAGAHPDVRSLQLPSDRDDSLGLPLEPPQRATRAAERVISIEAVRALQHDAALAPSAARWKVYLVIGAQHLSLDAANSLLKTLEEPPASVVLVLTAGDPDELLPTVVSRCQPIRLSPVSVADIARALQQRGSSAPEADLLARLSGGRPGWAIEATRHPAVVEERNRVLDDLKLASSPRYRDRFAVAERLASAYSRDQRLVLRTLSLWQLWWWDVHLLQRGLPELVTNEDRRDALAATARTTAPSQVRAHVRRLADASQWLVQNVNPRLALEALLVTGPVAR